MMYFAMAYIFPSRFPPHDAALSYGRGSVPSMAQRTKEREMKRKERQAQSIEQQEKENDFFAAKRALQRFVGSQILGRRRRSTCVAGDVGCASSIYERTTESNTRKEER